VHVHVQTAISTKRAWSGSPDLFCKFLDPCVNFERVKLNISNFFDRSVMASTVLGLYNG